MPNRLDADVQDLAEGARGAQARRGLIVDDHVLINLAPFEEDPSAPIDLGPSFWVTKRIDACMRVTVEGRGYAAGQLVRTGRTTVILPWGANTETDGYAPWGDRSAPYTAENAVGFVEVRELPSREIEGVSIDRILAKGEEWISPTAMSRVHDRLDWFGDHMAFAREWVDGNESGIDARIEYFKVRNGRRYPIACLRPSGLEFSTWVAERAGDWMALIDSSVFATGEPWISPSRRTMSIDTLESKYLPEFIDYTIRPLLPRHRSRGSRRRPAQPEQGG